MSLILRLIAAFLGGFGLHRLYTPTMVFGDRWGSMMREAIGITGMFPFLLLNHHAVKDIGNPDEQLTISYFLTAGLFGAGVAFGHIADRMIE